MSISKAFDSLLIHISGADQSGVTAQLIENLSKNGAIIQDLGQSVVNGHLVLSASCQVKQDSQAIKELLYKCSEKGLKIDIKKTESQPKIQSKFNYCLALTGNLSNGLCLSELTHKLCQEELNIANISTLSLNTLSGIELICTSKTELRQNFQDELFELAQKHNVNLSIQKDNIFRKNKKILCLDVDSTFLDAEVIDELAELNGAGKEVKEVTELAMQGQINFEEALRQRVMHLKGLSKKRALEHLETLSLSQGVIELTKVLKELGFKIGLVSGGFLFFVQTLKKKYNLDFCYANELECIDGTFTGKLIGKIIDSNAKAECLKLESNNYGIPQSQTVAMGDGANDIEMLKFASLGVAFKAKKALKKVAQAQINQNNLKDLLFLMGYSELEITTCNNN